MKKRILIFITLLSVLMCIFAIGVSAEQNAIKCTECDATLQEGDEFCSGCGAQASCKTCVDASKIEGSFCPDCGKNIAKSQDMEFKIDGEALSESVIITCYAMLGIFIVTAVIISFVLILNCVVEVINNKKKSKEQNKE